VRCRTAAQGAVRDDRQGNVTLVCESCPVPGFDDELNAGVYSPGMTGALAGVSGKSIGQWGRYGLIRPTVFHGRPANLYSYFDVAEALVVRWMLDKGITHQDIRLALDGVRGEFPEWPLLNAPLGIGRLSIDDRALLVRRDADDVHVYVDATGRGKPGQILIKPALLDRARDMLAHGGWLAAERGLRTIEVKPLKLGGVPSVLGRRWTVDQVARLADDEPGRTVLRQDYGLSGLEITEAVSWTAAAVDLVG
jgi:uncharacterized protein (DUF433 family)/DNA-binding transcriptional MerR regulator